MRVTVAGDVGEDLSRLCAALARGKHEVDFREVSSKFIHNLKGDIVFNHANAFPGKHGRAYLPTLLDGFNIPYTGPDALTHAMCQDHFSCRGFFGMHRIKTPRSVYLSGPQDLHQIADQKFGFPVVIRSNNSDGGDGLWICGTVDEFVNNIEDIANYIGWPMIIDEYVKGADLFLFAIGRDKDFREMKIMEIEHQGAIFDYSARSGAEYKEANLTKGETQLIKRMAYQAYHLLGIDTYARIDFRMGTDHIPYLLEVDPNPEFDARLEASIKAYNLSYEDMANYVLNMAISKSGIKENPERQFELFHP